MCPPLITYHLETNGSVIQLVTWCFSASVTALVLFATKRSACGGGAPIAGHCWGGVELVPDRHPVDPLCRGVELGHLLLVKWFLLLTL